MPISGRNPQIRLVVPRGRYVRLKPGSGAVLREAREDKYWSQRGLAALLNRRHTTISLLENEKMTTCTEELARNVCFHLGLPLGVVFTAPDGSPLPKLPSAQPVAGRRRRNTRAAA